MPLDAAQVEVPDLSTAPTTSDVVLEFIREAIVSGTLHEGEPIRQDDVARMFNISKIPVREALKQLEAEGFVIFKRNRGALVASISEAELVQVFEVQAMMEACTMQLSVPHMTSRTFELAQQAYDAFKNETDPSRWAQLNWQFHSSLYLDAERPFLLNQIRNHSDRTERFLRAYLNRPDGYSRESSEHLQILNACRAGDAERAANAAYDHTMGVCPALHKHLK